MTFNKIMHIIYRHTSHNTNTPKISELSPRRKQMSPSKRAGVRPDWFDHDKCFLNLLNTVDNNVESVIVSFDGDSNEFIKNFKAHPNWSKVDLRPCLDEGSYANFFNALNIVENELPEDSICYFLENDYLHVPNWPNKIKEVYESNVNFHYLSLYDHLQHYYLADNRKKCRDKYKNLKSSIFTTSTHHWRTIPMTCMSWISTIKNMKEDMSLLRDIVIDEPFFKAIHEAGKVLICPIPGLSTHCIYDYLSPAVNWDTVLEETVNE